MVGSICFGFYLGKFPKDIYNWMCNVNLAQPSSTKPEYVRF